MSVFVHVQGVKTVHAGEGQNSVHAVAECLLLDIPTGFVISAAICFSDKIPTGKVQRIL